MIVPVIGFIFKIQEDDHFGGTDTAEVERRWLKDTQSKNKAEEEMRNERTGLKGPLKLQAAWDSMGNGKK